MNKALNKPAFGLVISVPHSISRIHIKFYLQCTYIYLWGWRLSLLNNYQGLVKSDTRPEEEILVRHFSYFGPIAEGLLKQVNNEDWREVLKAASALAKEAVK